MNTERELLAKRRYRERHRDELRAKHRIYNHSESGRLAQARYVEKHREEIRERKRLWARRNPAPQRDPEKRRATKRRYYERHTAVCLERTLNYYRAHSERYREWQRARRIAGLREQRRLLGLVV